MRRRAKGGAKRRGKISHARDALGSTPKGPRNFVSEAGPGCVIAHGVDAPWCLGHERIDPRDYDTDAVFPDLAVDPESGILSVVNASGKARVAYVTVYDHPVLRADGTPHAPGRTVNADGVERECVTFIMTLPPRTIMHAARLADVTAEIDSDVQDWSTHPAPEDEHPLALGFPLGSRPGGDSENDSENAAYLCTQGENGGLTHFFSGNLHAVDFRCPVGCEVLAVADAEVVEVRDEETVTGIATANLFRWNSVTLKVETRRDADDENDEKPNGPNGGDLYVEYVHVAARSACVAGGERVRRGQKICASGSVGFSPEPHLHFTAFRSRDPAAPTVRVRFAAEPRRRRRESEGTADAASAKSANASSDASSEDGATFLPVAGRWYDAAGEAPAPRDS